MPQGIQAARRGLSQWPAEHYNFDVISVGLKPSSRMQEGDMVSHHPLCGHTAAQPPGLSHRLDVYNL